MDVKGIHGKMSVRSFALAALAEAGYVKKEYGDNGQRLKYLNLEYPNGRARFRFGSVSSLRAVKLRGKDVDQDWFERFKNAKENIIGQGQMEFFIQALRNLGEK